MIKFIKKHKLKFISYFLCAFAMALFTIVSFSCKTYAFTIDNNGNLVGDNIINVNDPSYIFNAQIVDLDIITTTTNNTTNGNVNLWLVDINATRISALDYGLLGSKQYTFTIDNNITGIQFQYSGNNEDALITYQLNFLNGYTYSFGCYVYRDEITHNYQISKIMLNEGSILKEWEPYGIWYSDTNYDTINNLYNNTLSQYNDLALGNNYGYWKYIDYVEFYVDNSNIYVPNTQEQNEWEISDLYNNNILKVGGYFDTFPLTMEPYQSNYNQVISYINFNAYTPSDSLIISFNNCDGCNVVINDDKSNSFTTIISETNYLIDINKIRESVPSFSLYVIEMYITPNNAEQNGIYFANNDYITAYNKGYNVATSNADRKYIPQITDLQNQINSLNNKIIELNNNINTLTALNTDLQNQINNSYSWQTLFFAFADTPFRVVSNVLGFELFGLNLFATFIGMITVFGVVYLLKKFL